MTKKNPWLAGILNIVPGLGYLYLGRRKVFSYLLLSAILLGVIEGYLNPKIQISNTLFSIIGTILVVSAFIYDAYKEAKE